MVYGCLLEVTRVTTLASGTDQEQSEYPPFASGVLIVFEPLRPMPQQKLSWINDFALRFGDGVSVERNTQ